MQNLQDINLPALENETTTINILHIEDSPSDATIVRKYFSTSEKSLYHYELFHAKNFNDGIDALEEHKNFDVILLDFNLPDGEGIDNIRLLKEHAPDIPVIIMTNLMNESIAQETMREGVQEYIVKEHGSAPIVKRVIQSSILRKKNEVQLSYQANYDSLTNLPNRRFFEDAATLLIAQAKRRKRRNALLFIDLNGFKQINDDYGHEAGNDVLVETSKRLQDTLRATDLVARYAGDEFVIYLDSGEQSITPELCRKIANKILHALKLPMSISTYSPYDKKQHKKSIEVKASIGIALYPEAGENFTDLLKNADKAMYQAKENPNYDYAFMGDFLS